eukprot:2731291-Rhodomonas_salina.1
MRACDVTTDTRRDVRPRGELRGTALRPAHRGCGPSCRLHSTRHTEAACRIATGLPRTFKPGPYYLPTRSPVPRALVGAYTSTVGAMVGS